jgi:hypothetical protein
MRNKWEEDVRRYDTVLKRDVYVDGLGMNMSEATLNDRKRRSSHYQKQLK